MGSAEVQLCRLPSLATGHGVAIGDTPQSVRQRLGMPTRVRWSQRKPGARIYSYIYVYRWRFLRRAPSGHLLLHRPVTRNGEE
jgi:hypothetical protein